MVIKFNIGLGKLSEKIVECFFPGKQIEILGNVFVVKKENMKAGKKDRIIFKSEYNLDEEERNIDKGKTKIKDGNYYIKMVNAKLKFNNNSTFPTFISVDDYINKEEFREDINKVFYVDNNNKGIDKSFNDRDYMLRELEMEREKEWLNNNIINQSIYDNENHFSLEIILYLTSNKVDTKCKIYNVGNYDENDDAYMFLKNAYQNLFEDSIKKSKSIEDSIKLIKYTNEDHIYVVASETKEKVKNVEFLLKNCKKVNSYKENPIYTNSRIFNILKDLSYEETSKFNDIIPIYKGWTGNLALDKIIYYMTYINMHTLNGIIFDDRVIYELNKTRKNNNQDNDDIKSLIEQMKNKESKGGEISKNFDVDNNENDELLNLIDKIVKRMFGNNSPYFDALGLYYYIDSDSEVKSFKKLFNINDKDFDIGKYIVIGPNNIKHFAGTYFEIYKDISNEISERFFDHNRWDYYFDKNIKSLIEMFTKIVFFHELGHMAFSNAYTLKTIESNESAANWYASINMDFIYKYIIYFMTLLQPSEYKTYFTNPTLLISGKQLKSENDIKNASRIFNINNSNAQTDVLNYKADAYKNYFKKVWWMLEDMYK